MESQTGCRSVEPTLYWALFRKLASPSLHHHHHQRHHHFSNHHPHICRCTLYISASAVAQILYNSRDRHLHISTLLSLLSTLHFSVLGLRHILNISHSDQVFIIILIDTLNFTIITIITLLCISRTECYATYSDPHVSRNWSRVHIPKNSFMYIF